MRGIATYALAAWALLQAVAAAPSAGLPSKEAHQARHDDSSEYSIVDSYFVQDDQSTDADSFNVTDTPNFGLRSEYTWDDLLDKIAQLNRKSDDTSYKLFFLARHGEGYHNVAPSYYLDSAWTCYWQIRDGNGQITWYDARLTDTGVEQANLLSRAWAQQIAHGAPVPESFYVSPLQRTLQTYQHTWDPISTGKTPVVKEFARETYGIGTESKRHPKSYIAAHWPGFEFEAGFSEQDELWTNYKHESKQHRNYRARQLLDDIFQHDANTVISLTSHSGLIHSILKVVNHRKFDLGTGQMIPVIIGATNPGLEGTPDLDKPWTFYKDLCPNGQSVLLAPTSGS